MLQQCHTLHLPNLLVILPISTRYSHNGSFSKEISTEQYSDTPTKTSTLSYKSLISKICLYMWQTLHTGKIELRNLGIHHLSNCLFVSPAQYSPAVLELGSAFLTKH